MQPSVLFCARPFCFAELCTLLHTHTSLPLLPSPPRPLSPPATVAMRILSINRSIEQLGTASLLSSPRIFRTTPRGLSRLYSQVCVRVWSVFCTGVSRGGKGISGRMGRQITSNAMGWDPEDTRARDSIAMRARERGNARSLWISYM